MLHASCMPVLDSLHFPLTGGFHEHHRNHKLPSFVQSSKIEALATHGKAMLPMSFVASKFSKAF